MQRYFIRRIFLAIPTIWIVISLVFLAVRALPGDFVTTKLAQLQGQGAETRRSVIEGERAVGPTVYRVAAGDTLASVAANFGISVERLLELNPSLTQEGGLTPGFQVAVVDGTAVQEIATATRTTVDALVQLNPDMEFFEYNDRLYAPAGETITIREFVTVEALAKSFLIDADDILQANRPGLDTNPDGDLAANTRLLPGDEIILPTTKITEASIRQRLGTDKPLYEQYVQYLWDTVRLDFGRSFQTNEPSLELMARSLPRTLQLNLYSLIVSLVIALPVGIISAIRQDTWMDYVLRSFAIIALAAPSFWIATMLIFVVTPGGISSGGVFSIPFTEAAARNIWDSPAGFFKLYSIPAIAGGIAIGAGLMRITRSALLEVLRQDYLRTAWAKGLPERTVIRRHALRNAMIPVLSVFGLQLAALIGGNVVLEVLFGIPGIGLFLFSRITQQDIPPIQTVVLIFAVFVIAVNLLIDMSYAYVDPRIRYS